jgi:chemotaxis protein CheD
MDMLLKKMIDQGAKRLNIRSKIYGGATILLNENQKMFKDIGSDNSNFAVKYLNKYNIPIIESDIGERKSRKIYFDSEDYSVFVQKI